MFFSDRFIISIGNLCPNRFMGKKASVGGLFVIFKKQQRNRTYNIIKITMSRPTENKRGMDCDQLNGRLLFSKLHPSTPSKLTNSSSDYKIRIKGCFSDLKEKTTMPLNLALKPTSSYLSPVSERLNDLKNAKTSRSDIKLRLEDFKQKINKINVMFFKDVGLSEERKQLPLQDYSVSGGQQKVTKFDYNSEKNSEYRDSQTKSFNSKGSTQVSENKEDTFKVLTLNGQKEIFKIIRYVNQGCYGKVYFVQHVVTNFICCLKVIKKEGLDEQMKGQIAREIKIQTYMSHPNIVKIYDFTHDEENIYLLLEPCLGGNLYEKINKDEISEKEAARFVRETCNALKFMHSKDIIHRDLKPENILIHQGTAKLCDFGWAIHSPLLRKTQCGTPLYLSPEVIECEYYDTKIDVWAIGILTYELLFKTIPFQIRSLGDLSKIVNDQIHFSEERMISEPAKEFIQKCLCKNPIMRVSIAQALEEEFLSRDVLRYRQTTL